MASDSNGFSKEISFSYVTPGEMLAAASTLSAVAIILVGLRFYVRKMQRAHIGIDDWLIVIGLAMTVAVGITLIIGVKQEVVAYPTPLPPNSSTDALLTYNPPQSKTMQQIEFALQLITSLGYGFIKLSIIFFYRRLFVVSQKSAFGIITASMAVIIILWSTTFFFGWIFACGTNVPANWGSRLDLLTYCPQRLPLTNGYLITDVLTDGLILLLPLPIIWNLKMPISRKVAVSGVFLMGSAAVGASIARLIISWQVTTGGFSANVDEDLTLSTIFYWYMIEAGIGVIAACLPTLRFLFGRMSRKSVSYSFRTAFSWPPHGASHRGSSIREELTGSSASHTQGCTPTRGSMESTVAKESKEAYVLGEVQPEFHRDGQIHVKKEISQKSEHV